MWPIKHGGGHRGQSDSIHSLIHHIIHDYNIKIYEKIKIYIQWNLAVKTTQKTGLKWS